MEIFGGTSDLRGCPPIIFLPPVSSCVVGKCFTALSSSCSLFEGCSWLLHPGGNCLDRNKIEISAYDSVPTLQQSSYLFFFLLPCSVPKFPDSGMLSANMLLWTHSPLLVTWSLVVTHNFMTVSLNNTSIIEGDGSGDRNSGNEKTVSLFLSPIFYCSECTVPCRALLLLDFFLAYKKASTWRILQRNPELLAPS